MSEKTEKAEPFEDRGLSKETLRVADLPSREIEEILVRGEAPDAAALAGWEYRGLNTKRVMRIAGIRKFIKGFFRSGDELWGFNSPVKQNADGAPWIPVTRQGPFAKEARTPEEQAHFGFYRVVPVDPEARDNMYLHALLLDYSRGDNPALDPSRTLRDYLVRVNAGSDDLLLGKAVVALGSVRVPVPVNYFLLEKRKRHDFKR